MTDVPYRISNRIDAWPVKDQSGIVWTHHQNPSIVEGNNARVRDPIIDWIGPQYLDRWLAMGVVTEVGDESIHERRPLPEPAPVPPSARYRMTGEADALYVTEPDGRTWLHIFDPIVAESTEGARGPVIEWLSREQSLVFLLQGFIVEIGREPAPAALPAPEPVELVPVATPSWSTSALPISIAWTCPAKAGRQPAEKRCGTRELAMATRSLPSH